MNLPVDAPLWRGFALISALNARVVGSMPLSVDGISIDSRTLNPQDLFFAIAGEHSDGHDYVKAAFAKGAAAAVVREENYHALREEGPLFVVEDVQASLNRLASAARKRSKARLAAITGSVGKTSTKDALALVLSASGTTHAAQASYNNHWGVPLTLARMPQQSKFGVFEIGMNHQGEITPLSEMIHPHIALVTKIAAVHLAAFPEGLEGIARAKAEIFSGLVDGGVAILNGDDPQSPLLETIVRQSPASYVLRFGRDPSADARLIDVKLFADSSEVEAEILGQMITYRLGAPGMHFVENSLAVLLAARSMGVDLETAAANLREFAPPSGRGRRYKIALPQGEILLIDESYNANPTSMLAAFAVLSTSQPTDLGRRIAVVGDMLELGPEEQALHLDLVEPLENSTIDRVYAAGKLMGHLFEALCANKRGAWRQSSLELLDPLVSELRAGDIVMVKGSNGSAMGAIVKALQERYPAPNSFVPIAS